jgi:DNA polymerase-3 subunit chi
MANGEEATIKGPEINFYHLTITPKMVALPKLLEKCLETKMNSCVYFRDADVMEEVSAYLWSYSSMTMIPHGKDYEEFASDQPIILTSKQDYPVNDSKIAIYFDASAEMLKEYSKIIFLFDGNDAKELNEARERWKSLKNANHEILYWKQDEKGGWSKQ